MTGPFVGESVSGSDPIADVYYVATLEFVNETRERLGYSEPLPELPVGVAKSNCDCPISRATGCKVGPIGIGINGEWRLETPDGGRARLPFTVTEFARRFDLGKYPELIER